MGVTDLMPPHAKHRMVGRIPILLVLFIAVFLGTNGLDLHLRVCQSMTFARDCSAVLVGLAGTDILANHKRATGLGLGLASSWQRRGSA